MSIFKHILVPLDGSKLSEASLGAAAVLAQELHSRVTLLHVIEEDAPAQIHADRHLTRSDEAEAYLRDAARRTFPGSVKVETHVHSAPVADVARSIADHASTEFAPDLIVICAHGRGGVHGVLVGSIAQQVVARGATPLLLIKPASPAFRLDKILLALDPDSAHDDSLPVGESLAQHFGSEIALLSVVPTYSTLVGEQAATSSLMPAATQAFLALRQDNARAHLEQHVEDLKRRNMRASFLVARGDPAPSIVRAAEQVGADMIILSTHRKSGIGAFWARSVAPNVARLSKTALLLLPLLDKP
jgi:nucleotide-binding universal stress UspA family protein